MEMYLLSHDLTRLIVPVEPEKLPFIIFLLECPHYAVQRIAIHDLIAPNTHHSLLPTLDANRLTIILLKGSDDLVIIENAFIYRCVKKFIKSSNRFS